MEVLVLSTNTLPSSPSGPAYIAGTALAAGHRVQIFETLFYSDPIGALEKQLADSNPDIVAVSIRLVHGYILDENAEYGTRHLDLRVRVKQVVDCVRRISDARIVLGGPGFNYYGPDWLAYLDLDYGIRGEADNGFPRYLKCVEEGGDIHAIPGSVFRRNGGYVNVPRERVENLDATAFPAYELCDLENYAELGISPAILTKRGCAFRCTYCPYSELEGKRYRLKTPARVVDELEHVYRINRPKLITFCDNNFNVPNKHAKAICQEIIDRKLALTWGTGSIKPLGVTEEVCRLFAESGCGYVNLSVESASTKMLKRMRRGCTVEDIRQALTSLSRSGIDFGVSLMIGAPGETPQTVSETLRVLEDYDVPRGVWVTIGICLWSTHQKFLEDARVDGQLKDDKLLFEGTNYVSPQLPRDYMTDLVAKLRKREDFTVQVNKLHAGHN